MSESEETKWRLSVEPEEAEERAAELSSEEDEKKEGFQQTIQAKADEIGGGGEVSIVAEPIEEPITEVQEKKKKERKLKSTAQQRESDTGKSMAAISNQVQRQANQLTRIEKTIISLQKSINKIDKQSNKIKQVYVVVTQLQRQVRSSKNRKQNQTAQKKKAGKKSSKMR